MRNRFRVIAGMMAVLFVLLSLSSCAQSGSKERMADQSNTLYVGYVGTSFPSSFMPWQSREGIAPTLASMIYSTLFSYDDLTDVYEPHLAVDWCYIDPDGNPIRDENGKPDYEKLEEIYGESATYLPVKVTLNDHATWSDGVKVTAEDIYFTFDLCADNSRSGHAGALAWISDLQHTYSNGNKVTNGIFTYNHNQGNKYTFAEDEKDTVIYLHVNKVLGSIATLFSTILILPEHIWSSVISKEMPANSTTPNSELTYLYQHPVGCGPYTLDVENSNAQVIYLDRREDYHETDPDDPTQPLYKVDRIKFILYQEENVAIFALLKGYIDVLDSSINPNYRSLFLKEENMQVLETTSSFVQTLVLNMNPTKDNMTDLRSLLTHQDFRRAIALAIDQEDLIKNVKDQAATTYSAGLISSDFSEIYNEDSNILSSPIEERLTEANEILDKYCPEKDEKGYRLYNGKRVSYEITANVSDQDLVSFLQIQFQKIGIEVTYKAAGSSPENTYYYSGKFDMTFQSVTFSSSNVDIMMKSHFVNLNKSSNYGRLVNEELTSKIEEMRSTLNLNLKNELIKELQVLVAEQYYKIPLYSSNIISVARTDRYTGWVEKAGDSAFSTDSLTSLKRVS